MTPETHAVPTRELLAKNLRHYRETAGWKTRSEVERALGWSSKRYENYEIGRAAPPFDALWELAQLFDVSVDDLLNPAPDGGGAGVVDPRQGRLRLACDRATDPGASPADILDAVDLLLARLRERAN